MDRGDILDTCHERVVKADVFDGALGQHVERREKTLRFSRAHAGLDACCLCLAAHADEDAVALGGDAGMDSDGKAPQLRAKVLFSGRKETVHVEVAKSRHDRTRRTRKRRAA